MNETRTTCPYCGVGCGIIINTDKDGNVSLRGDPEHPANFGRLCSKGSALDETLCIADRLLYPEIDGQSCDWDMALDSVAERLQSVIDKYGAGSVAFYVSGQLLTEDYYVANKLMKGYLGSANIDTNSRLCMSSAVSAYKRAFGSDSVPCCYEDLEQANLIVLTGSNTAWCHPVVYQRIAQAKKDNPNLYIIVIDPRRTATCEIADLHLALAPGTDAILFNGLLNYLAEHQKHNIPYTSAFTEDVDDALAAARESAADVSSVAQRCALTEPEVEEFYSVFAQTEKVVTLFSQGINQSTSGTDKGNAIINCHLLTGRLGQPGMGPFSITGQPNAMGGREVGGLANQLAAHMEIDNPEHRNLVQTFWQSPRIADQAGHKAVDLFNAIETGEIKAVWIMATNPVVSMPEADRVRNALAQCELVIVSDNVAHTDTLDLAHIKLPALGWGEKDGTVTNSERRISRQRAFLSSPGEAKPDWWIISEVAKRLGFTEGFDYAHPAEIFDEHARLTAWHNDGQRDLDLGGLGPVDQETYEQFQPFQWPVSAKRPYGSARLFCNGRFFHPDGKARFVPVHPRIPACNTSQRLPLQLNTGRVRDQWHSMTRSGKSPRLTRHIPEPYVEIHPLDAERYNIETGSLATVSGEHGQVIVRARVSEQQQPGSLFVPIHWNDQFASAARIDSLITGKTDPISGQPELKHAPVSVKPYQPAWHGFLLSRHPTRLDNIQYWSRSRGQGLWRYQLAGEIQYEDWPAQARTFLEDTDHEGDWVEYLDPANLEYRAARLINGRLDSCLYIARGPELPGYDWLERLFEVEQISSRQGIALLAGKPLIPEDDPGPTICACFGVGRNTLCKSIREEGLDSVDAIGERLRAGTNCGSCIPEL
ncbi:MAG: molybdopterin-dependent oxidoreductase, partial [Thiohalophilus sp.]